MNLGGGETGDGVTRVRFRETPMVTNGLLPRALIDHLPTGSGDSFATYDTSADAAGIIGVRALTASEHETGIRITNPEHGGSTASNANYLIDTATEIGGPAASINTLTFDGGSLSLQQDQQLFGSEGDILTKRGSTATISGGSLLLGTATAGFLGDGDLLVESEIKAPGPVVKLGAGTLRLGGGVEAPAGMTIAEGIVTMNDASGETGAVIVGARGTLRGGGRIGGETKVLGTLAPGDGIGELSTGGLRLEAGSTLELELAAPGSFDRLAVAGSLGFFGDVRLALELAPAF